MITETHRVSNPHKIVHVDANMNVRKQIMRELQFMHDCNSKHIVSFYGAFMNGGDISICMEYMDAGYVQTPLFHSREREQCRLN